MNGMEGVVLLPPDAIVRYWDRPNADDWASELARFPLFGGVGKRQLRRLAQQASLAEFARGDAVVSAGSTADALYVILGGAAKAVGKQGARILRVGDYFGELGLIDETSRSATVVAIEELHVMRVPSRAILRVARRNPEVTRTMLVNLSAQLRRLEAHVAHAA